MLYKGSSSRAQSFLQQTPIHPLCHQLHTFLANRQSILPEANISPSLPPIPQPTNASRPLHPGSAPLRPRRLRTPAAPTTRRRIRHAAAQDPVGRFSTRKRFETIAPRRTRPPPRGSVDAAFFHRPRRRQPHSWPWAPPRSAIWPGDGRKSRLMIDD